MKEHLVVFDGTSAYVMNREDYTDLFLDNRDLYDELKVLRSFNDLDEAADYAESENEEINK